MGTWVTEKSFLPMRFYRRPIKRPFMPLCLNYYRFLGRPDLTYIHGLLLTLHAPLGV